jgi:hypothetical protein
MTDDSVMRKLGYFVVLSVLTHLWLMYGVPIEMPHFDAPPPVLEARLQPAPPLPPVVPHVKPVITHPTPRHAPPKPEPAAEPVMTSASPAAAPPISAPEPQVAPAPVEAAPGVSAVAAPEIKPATPPPPAQPLARRLPHKGEIAYVLYLGNDRFNVGRTVQSWEISGDRYRLASVSETAGLAAIFSRQRLAYESQGRLTAAGLQPDHFTTERVRSGKSEKAAADFNWAAASAAIGNPPRSVALPAGAQDIVSFMYQLGLTPLTPGRIELPITNGWKLERYEMDIGIEELLDTPFGPLRAVPVRIRFFNRDGEPSGEQLVTDIRVSEN